MFTKFTVITLLGLLLLLYCVESSAYRGTITFPKEVSIIEQCAFDDGSRGKCVKNENCSVPNVRGDLLRKSCNEETVCCPTDVNSIKFHKLACLRHFPGFKPLPRDPSKKPPLYILGGDKIRPGEFPYVVALGWHSSDGSHIKYNCGGVLIDPSFVLTAAHCANSPVVVLPGGINITDTHEVPHNISRIYVHPDYIENQLYNDIALIELQEPVRYPPACLSDDKLPMGSRVTAVGYGYTDDKYTRSMELLKGEINIVSNEECHEYFKLSSKTHKGIVDAQFCGKDEKMRQATCKGDSGGPIMMDIRGPDFINRPFVVGITSHGVGCSSKYPGIYTKVDHYIDWIESIVWRNFRK